MGLFNIFKKRSRDEVRGTRVLVAILGSQFPDSAQTDSRCYSQSYPATAVKTFESAPALLREIKESKYDVVHLLCTVTPEGTITDSQWHQTAAEELMQTCVTANVKLLWLARENAPENYIKGFKTGGRPINLVMTLDRRGPVFQTFLDAILRKMSSGMPMPSAWVSLAPQSPNDPRNLNAPACIFAAGRAGVRLL